MIAALAATLVIPLGGHYDIPTGVAASVGGGFVIEAVHRSHAVDIVRLQPGRNPVTLARLHGVEPHSTLIATSRDRWVVGVRGGAATVIATGAPGGGGVRRVVSCRRRTGSAAQRLSVAVAGSDIAYSGSRCPGTGGVRVVPAGRRARRIAAAGVLTALSPAAAVVGNRLVSRATGASVPIRVKRVAAAAFDDDGSLVVLSSSGPRCDVPPCAAARVQLARVDATGRVGATVPLATQDPFDTPLIAAGGGRALAVNDRGVVAVDLASGAQRFAGFDGPDPGAFPLGVDAARAAWLTIDCRGAPEVMIGETTATAAPAPTTPQCPLRFGATTLPLRGGHATVRVTCPAGCDTQVDLRARGRTLGFDTAALKAGQSTTLRFPLDAAARALVRRSSPLAARLVEVPGGESVPNPPVDVTVVAARAAAATVAPVAIPLALNRRQIVPTQFAQDPFAFSFAAGAVVQAVDRGTNGVDVVRRAPGQVAVVLAHADSLAPGVRGHSTEVAVSGTSWVAAITGGRVNADHDFRSYDETILSGPLAGGPAHRVSSCIYPHPEDGVVRAAISGDDVAFSDALCGRTEGVWLVPAGEAPQRVAPGSVEALSPASVVVRGADEALRLVRRADGASIPVAGSDGASQPLFDQDGTLLDVRGTIIGPHGDAKTEVVRVAPDGSATPVATLRVPTIGAVAGGGRLLITRPHGAFGVMAVDLASGARGYAGADDPGGESAQPVAVDATRTAWLSTDCTGRPRVVIDATVPRAPEAPTVTPCPLRLRSRTIRLRGRLATAKVSCPAGCSLVFVLRAGGLEAGTGALTLRPGPGLLRLTLSRRARRLLRHSRRLPGELLATNGIMPVPLPAFRVTVR